MKYPSLALLALAASMVGTPALAAPTTSVSGVIFADYRMPSNSLSGGLPQSFNVMRAFLSGTAKLDDMWSAQVTLNPYALAGYTAGAAPEQSVALLQYAYIQAKDLVPMSTMQLGVVTEPWIDYEYPLWGYRMLGLTPINGGISTNVGNTPAGFTNSSYIPAWDKGLKLTGDLPFVKYGLAVMNGEGFKVNETDGQKSYEGRLSILPLEGLDITGMMRRANPAPSSGNAVSDVYFAGLGYTNSGYRFALQGTQTFSQTLAATTATAGRIYTAFGILPIPGMSNMEVILRADQINPNVDLTNTVNARVETIVGIACKPTKGVTFVLDNQNVNRTTTTAGDTQNNNTVALHSQFVF